MKKKKYMVFTISLIFIVSAILLIFFLEEDRSARPGLIMSLGALIVVIQRVAWLFLNKKGKKKKKRRK
ncbi:hypothetical protein [Guptibacillus hwajinpoensis]|uniref:Uncharacterized protein n=1 Tax=Guptibacillus hwajinpoensis TaxID=208199 RepID=A0A0J6D2C8_9BACL|nr:hypothetical protein [Alkalihalobacillus macyae]KMM39485.1 hypothetical protein AB986_09915 [Alkalihalobacillus macyae]